MVLKGKEGSDPEADTDASQCPLFHLYGCNLPFRTVEGFRAPSGVLNPDRYDPR